MKPFSFYVLCILFVNVLFMVVPPVDLGFGLFSPAAIAAGVVFIARDFAQRAVGHRVLFGMALGAVLSYFLASPALAIASTLAFVVSELADWGVYTVTKRPFHQRVLISSVLAVPVDSLIFLYMVDILTPVTYIIMVAAKIVTALVYFWWSDLSASNAKDIEDAMDEAFRECSKE